MTDQERLEEIKLRFNAMNELESFKKLRPTEKFFDDIGWLISTVEEQQEENKNLRELLEVKSAAYDGLLKAIGAVSK